MTIQDHNSCSDYSTLLAGEDGIFMDDAGQTIGDGHVPKIRKQYTITKQRERWTEEEHKKFLEALKLFGRAWRKIEEHVGTKTAVQIRSHAQKFFSKVVRESHNSNPGSVKHMEIPPPRPKRKPMHPYPRKLVIPVQSASSTSPNSSVDQEHRSPTSVISGFASERLQFEDSITPDGSSSPVSSHDDSNHYNDSMVQENISQLIEPVSVKLELSPNEPTSPKFIKLFGKTMLLEVPEKPSTELIAPSAPVPLHAFCVGTPFFVQDKATHNEGSFSGFTAGSVNAQDNCDLNQETRTQYNECSLKSTQQKFSAKLRRASSEKYTRAFVPYKRSLSEKSTQSSTTTCTVLID